MNTLNNLMFNLNRGKPYPEQDYSYRFIQRCFKFFNTSFLTEIQGEMNYIELKHKFSITSIDEAFGCLFSTKLNRHERLKILKELRWSYRYMRNCLFRIMKEASNEEILKRLLDHESIPKELLDKRDGFVFKRLTRYEFIEEFPYWEAKRQLNDEAKLNVLNYFIKLFHHVNHPTMYRWFPQGNSPSDIDTKEKEQLEKQYDDLTGYRGIFADEDIDSDDIVDIDDYDNAIDERYYNAVDLVKEITKNQLIKHVEQSILKSVVEHYNAVRSDFKARKNVEYTNAFDSFIHDYLINNPDEKDRTSVIQGKIDEIWKLMEIPKPIFPSLFKVFSGKIGLIRTLRSNEYNTSNYLPLKLENETPATLECCWEEETDDSSDDSDDEDNEEDNEDESEYDLSEPDEEICLCPDDHNGKLVWGMEL